MYALLCESMDYYAITEVLFTSNDLSELNKFVEEHFNGIHETLRPKKDFVVKRAKRQDYNLYEGMCYYIYIVKLENISESKDFIEYK